MMILGGGGGERKGARSVGGGVGKDCMRKREGGRAICRCNMDDGVFANKQCHHFRTFRKFSTVLIILVFYYYFTGKVQDVGNRRNAD